MGSSKTVFGLTEFTPSNSVENWIAVNTESGFGVTGPAKRASMASGRNGVEVNVGVLETSGVTVSVGGTVMVGVNVMVGVSVMVGVNDGVADGGKT